MTTYIPVSLTPAHAARAGGRLTKKRLTEMLAETPAMDFLNQSIFHPGTYVNGYDARRMDLRLEVHNALDQSVAIVDFGTIGPDGSLRALVH